VAELLVNFDSGDARVSGLADQLTIKSTPANLCPDWSKAEPLILARSGPLQGSLKLKVLSIWASKGDDKFAKFCVISRQGEERILVLSLFVCLVGWLVVNLVVCFANHTFSL